MTDRIVSFFSRFAAAAALVLGAPSFARAADLVAYTEEWPPYNYTEQGQVKGIATEALRAACAEAQLSCEINMVPWARAYAVVSGTPDTLLYTTARKPSREKEFLWVGPLFPRATWVYGRAGSPIRDFKELARHKVGIVRGEASEQDLEKAGVPRHAMMPESSNALVLKALLGGWVDAMVDTEIGMAWNLRTMQLPAGEVQRLMKLTDEGAYYFALNLKTDPTIRERLQRALDKLQKNGRLAALSAGYAPSRR